MEKVNTNNGKMHQSVVVDRLWYSLEGNRLLSRNSVALKAARWTVISDMQTILMSQTDKMKLKLRIPRLRYYLNGKQGAEFCETPFSFEQTSLKRSLTTISQNVHKWALNTAVQRRIWVKKLWKCALFFNGNRTVFPVNATFREYTRKTFSKNKFQVTWVPMRQFKSPVRINTLSQNPRMSEFTNARMKEKTESLLFNVMLHVKEISWNKKRNILLHSESCYLYFIQATYCTGRFILTLCRVQNIWLTRSLSRMPYL
jgi:hypothetical protein